MAIRRESIGKQIRRILMLRPNRDDATGMLYKQRRELQVKRKKVTLIGVFVSDEGTFLIRPHLFESKDGRTAAQWEEWFRENYTSKPKPGDTRTPILTNILEGMENRTGKQWRLYRIIGWMPDDSTRLIRAKTRTQRNQTKRKGR